MNTFISNSNERTLKKRLQALIAKSEELKFLVGFFYFSGIRELYESIKTKPDINIKVLVGLNVDKAVWGLSEYREGAYQNEEEVFSFFESIKKSFNTDDFDTKEFHEQARFFLKLLIEDRLIIRKTEKPNHAKLYIFKLEDDQVGRNALFITGSSNLTKSGLSTQDEFNVEISDYGVEDANNYFDELWRRAILITEKNTLKEKLICVIENETHLKQLTPFEAFALVLKSYLETAPKKDISQSALEKMEKAGYTPYTYQIEAVEQAKAIVEAYNGVVIADVVGLGKSIIASMLACDLNCRGAIICPPGLIGDKSKTTGWRKYTEEFSLLGWEAWSMGDLENAQAWIKKAGNIEAVIIDEAHRFRNRDTKGYEILKNICRNKKVILVTATPFNNSPQDILSLLELFIIPKKSPITLENNLKAKFSAFNNTFKKLADIKKYYNASDSIKRRRAGDYYAALFGDSAIDLARVKERAHHLSLKIRDVIEPITIRRNRLDLQKDPAYKNEVALLSEFADPEEWFFELSREQARFYDEVLQSYFAPPSEGGRFTGAIYKPFEYDSGKKEDENLDDKENRQLQQQRNLHDFMRRLLVKRFESSLSAFAQSIKNFYAVTEKVLEFIEASGGKYILDRALLEKIYELDEGDIEKELLAFSDMLSKGNYPKNNKVYDIADFKLKKEFLADIESDKKLFSEILQRIDELKLIKNDPKSKTLIEKIREILARKPASSEPKRKIVIFTEYKDTAVYVEGILRKKFPNRVLAIAGNTSAETMRALYQNFDASHSPQKDEYDILLATDKISEGFNFNRAGIVVNYDIPWNPVRVIQRVGRINRISKKVFETLYLANFFPTEKGATIVKSREIAQHKMFLIHNTLGEDAKIFDIDESPSPAKLYHRLNENPEKSEKESFYTRIRVAYEKIKAQHPEVIEKIADAQSRTKVAKAHSEQSLLVFIRKGRMYIREVEIGEDGKPKARDVILEEVFKKIECGKAEPRRELSDLFWDYYEEAKQITEPIITKSEAGLEQRALNVLKTILSGNKEELAPVMPFLRTLRQDILDYGTLSDYTLRRIEKWHRGKDALLAITALVCELGRDYLEKEKAKIKTVPREVIIAIENQ